MSRSYVVTGAGGGIGRALVGRLLEDADDNAVVAIELDSSALSWLDEHRAGWLDQESTWRWQADLWSTATYRRAAVGRPLPSPCHSSGATW